MAETSLDVFKAKDTRFVADWLKSKGLHKLCSVFEGIQEPCLHTQLPGHNSFPEWGHLITWNGAIIGHLNSFSASEGGNLNKDFPKIQMPGGLPGGMFKLPF